MSTRDVYERGFDEETGRTITGTTCPECPGELETDGGETSCRACGLIVDSYYLDHGATAWTDSEADRSGERTGPPSTATRHDRGISSEIGRAVDSRGTQLSGKKRRQLSRLRRQHSRGRWGSKAERNLTHGLVDIARLTAALDLPHSLREQASALFRRAQGEDLLRGRSIEGMAAGCVYACCRLAGITRSLAELTECAHVSERRVLNCYRTLNETLGLPIPPQSPREFVDPIAAEIELPQAVVVRATEFAVRAHETGVSAGKHPAGFAAACLLSAATEHGVAVQQAEVAAAADVCAVTVRNNRESVRELAAST
ncbi:transcription initiation factor IIB [Haloarcula sp. GH36]|uniref:transcription initiation factor IIB n=1 Tax=Haloarcula montana TaxID=3111776 RepID=UPI002D77852C|nr:transcription initiation factor IIB family protein [Haloarcula sp. GH36]